MSKVETIEKMFLDNEWHLVTKDSISGIFSHNKQNINLKCVFILKEDGTSKVCHILNHDLALVRSYPNDPVGIWDISKTMALFQKKEILTKCHGVPMWWLPEWYEKRDRKCLECGNTPMENVDYCEPCIKKIASEFAGVATKNKKK